MGYGRLRERVSCFLRWASRVPRATVRGVGINYDVVGSRGPWLMLIQGGRQDMELFRPLASHFADAGYRVIIHDRRNSGLSDIAVVDAESEEELFADDAYELCSRLGALPVIACGGAGGSRHCILMALRHPGSVHRALLLWWPSGSRPAAELLAERYYGEYITAASAGGMAGVLATPYYAELCARVPENRSRLLALDVGQFVAVMQRWRQFFLDGADDPVIGVPSDVVQRLTLPTCIIPGGDTIHPPEIAHALAATLPNAELHEVPRMQVPAPPEARLAHQQRLADTFLAFLSRHP